MTYAVQLTVAETVDVLRNQYDVVDVIDCDQFAPDAIELYVTIQKNYRTAFSPNEALIFLITKDYATQNVSGSMLRSIQKILNDIDISNAFVHLVTTNPNVIVDYQQVLTEVSHDPVPWHLHCVPGPYQVSTADVKEFYALNSRVDWAFWQHLTESQKDRLFHNKSFCMKPWTALHVEVDSKVRPCCMFEESVGDCSQKTLQEIFHDAPMRQVREDMLAGRLVDACRRCYNKEDRLQSRTSMRLDSLRDRVNVISVTDKPSTAKFKLLELTVSFNNLCNLACITCGPKLSTSWHAPAMHFGLVPEDHKPLVVAGKGKIDLVTQVLDNLDHIDHLNFTGGEPLMSDQLYEILTEIQRRGRTDTDIFIVTNLTKRSLGSRAWVDVMRGLPKLTLQASIDAEGSRHEYIRPGADWSDIIEFRSELLREIPNLLFAIIPVVTLINALHLPDLHRSWVDRNLVQAHQCKLNWLTHPPYLEVRRAPKALRRAIIDKYIDHVAWLKPLDPKGRSVVTFENVIQVLQQESDPFDAANFWQHIGQLDQYHNRKLFDSFPELQSYLT